MDAWRLVTTADWQAAVYRQFKRHARIICRQHLTTGLWADVRVLFDGDTKPCDIRLFF